MPSTRYSAGPEPSLSVELTHDREAVMLCGGGMNVDPRAYYDVPSDFDVPEDE